MNLTTEAPAEFEPIPFIASSAEEAVAKIRARLGSDAVVLNVRPIKPPGLARLWQKPMIEVVACRPQLPAPIAAPSAGAEPSVSEALAGFRQELDEIKRQTELNESGWRVAPLLQKTGLLPLHAKHILDAVKSAHGDTPPSTLGGEIALVAAQLSKSWRSPREAAPHSLHILIGPAGSGKTTALCKWLSQTALVEGRLPRAWRLDGLTANTAETLSVYCDILNIPSERSWTVQSRCISEDIGFIDLPGVDWRSPSAIQELTAQLAQYGSPHLHLVLNGAYDISVLLAQARAFAALPIEDLLITHLDEEPHWGKLWNLSLGAGHPIRHLSSGPNIPGGFIPATPEAILARQFPVS
jgi:flagellar biosynthesis protein FlhF